MKTIIYNIFFTLIPCLAWAQYLSNDNQKIKLGEQTTADGLIFRGVASIDTVSSTSKITRANKQDTSTYILLDTVTNLLWHYKTASNGWSQAGGSTFDTTSIKYVNTYGTQTINGTKTFSSATTFNNTVTATKFIPTDSIKNGYGTYKINTSTIGINVNNSSPFRITETGNWGIIDENPQNLLSTFSSDARGGVISNSYPILMFNEVGNSKFLFGLDGNEGYLWGFSNVKLRIATNGGERMRIETNGNVGIGNTSPGSRLVVKGVNNTSGESALNVTNSSDNPLLFVRNDGNVGIGVTPSAWRSGDRAFQIGNYLQLFSESGVTSDFSNNTFINSSGQFTYINTAQATRYRQYLGEHQWLTASSGTANNPISFTQAMTLDASGTLLVGATSAINSNFKINILTNSGNGGIVLRPNTDGTVPLIRALNAAASLAVAEIGTSSGSSLYFNTNGSPRLTITSTGAATFSSSVTATNESFITSSDGGGKMLKFTGGTTKYNFMIAVQQNVNNALEITPSTAAGGSTFSTPALTILSNGNVGIGTTNPSSKLEIFQATYTGSTNYVTKNIKINSGFGSGYVSGTIVSLLSGYDGTTIYGTDIGHSYDGTGYSLIFSTNDNTGGDVIERMRITREGNVTIGNSISTGILTSGSTTIGHINAKSFLLGTNGTETNYRWQNYIDASNNYKLYSRNYGDALSIGYTTGAATFSSSVTTAGLTSTGAISFTPSSFLVGSATATDVNSLTTQAATSNYYIRFRASDGSDQGGLYQRTLGGPIKINSGFEVASLVGIGNRTVYSTADGALTNSSSDITLKTNIIPIAYGLNTILKLKPITYNWINTNILGTQTEIGFIAQEVQIEIPELIGKNSNGKLSLDYPKMVAILTKAIQELSAQVDILKQEIINLKNK